MANTGFKGVDVRQTGNQLVFRAFLQNSSGAIVTAGTTTLKLYELQSDGTLKSYDFNDNTFKITALTTETLAMSQRQGNNNTTNTGLWTVALSTLTGFTAGGVYFAMVNNSTASPTDQMREFQYGSEQGDLVVTANGTGVGEINSDLRMWMGTAPLALSSQQVQAVIPSSSTVATVTNPVLVQSGTGANQINLSSGNVTLADASLTTAKLGTFVLAKTTNITGFNDIAATAIVSAGAITTSSGAVSNVTTVGSVSGAVGSVTGNVSGDVTGSVGSLATQAKTDVENAVWNATQSNHVTSGTFGLYLDTTVSSRLATSSYTSPPSAATISSTVWSEASRTLTEFAFSVTVATNNDKTGYSISGTKTTLDDLNDISTTQVSTAVCGTAVPGAFASGTLGYVIGTYLDATISSRLATASYTSPPSAATISSTVWAETSRTLTAFSFAVALAASQPNYAPAVAGDAMTLTTAYDAAKTAAQAGDAMTLTTGERNNTADAILVRDTTIAEATAGDHTLCAVILAGLESSISGTTWTIKKSDGTTTFLTKTVTVTAGASPITGVQ